MSTIIVLAKTESQVPTFYSLGVLDKDDFGKQSKIEVLIFDALNLNECQEMLQKNLDFLNSSTEKGLLGENVVIQEQKKQLQHLIEAVEKSQFHNPDDQSWNLVETRLKKQNKEFDGMFYIF